MYLFRKKKYKQSLSILTNTNLEKNFKQNQNEKDIADYFHLLSRVYEKLELFNESYNFAIKRNKTILAFEENKNFSVVSISLPFNLKFSDQENEKLIELMSLLKKNYNCLVSLKFISLNNKLLDFIAATALQTKMNQ